MKNVVRILFYIFISLIVISCRNLTPQEIYAKKHFSVVKYDNSGQITELYPSDRSLYDLTFLKSFPKLRVLSLSCYNITDFSPLSSLHELTDLDMDTLSPSESAPDRINDLSFLKGVRKLQSFWLLSGKVKSLMPLKYLNNLKKLVFNDVSAPSYDPIKYLKSLVSLRISFPKIYHGKFTDLTPIGDLSNLESLEIQGDYNITDLTPLGKLKKLKYLSIVGHEKISDISALAQCTSLESIVLGSDGVKDLTPLYGLKKLRSLDIGGVFTEDDVIKLIHHVKCLSEYGGPFWEDLADKFPKRFKLDLSKYQVNK